MKLSSLVVPVMLVAVAYVYYNHAPEGGWSTMLSECKHCSSQQGCSKQEITVEASVETASEVQTTAVVA